MKNFNSIFNQLTAMPKRLAMVLTVLFTLGVGSMWGADYSKNEVWDFGKTGNTNWSGHKSDYCGACGSKSSAFNVYKTDITNFSNIDFSKYENVSLTIYVKAGTNSGTNSYTVKLIDANGNQVSTYTSTKSSGMGSGSNSSSAKESSVTFSPTVAFNGYKIEFPAKAYITQTRYVLTYDDKAASYTITAESNNTNYGTVSLSGTIITASPKTGYRVSTTTPYTISPTGSATVEPNGNTFTIAPSANTTITINFEAIPTHKVYFNTGGLVDIESVDVQEGQTYNITQTPASSLTQECEYNTFVGWTKSNTIANPSSKPTIVNSIEMESSDITLYAVYSKTEGGGGSAAEQGTTMFSENWKGCTNNTQPTQPTSSGSVVYNAADIDYVWYTPYGGSKTQTYTSGGPNSNENILISKNNGYWKVVGIPTGQAETLTLSFSKSGSGVLSVSTSTSNVSISGSTITIGSSSVNTFDLIFTNTKSGDNLRLDDISVVVAKAGATGSTTYSLTPECTTETIVTFELNGGSGTFDDVTLNSNTYAIPGTEPTRNGYNFTGWKIQGGDETIYKYGTSNSNISNITESITLVAQWTAIEYTITYHLNGGSGVENSIYTIESNDITLQTPEKQGLTFVGWYENADFTGYAVTKISRGSTGNKEFWAKWEKSTPTFAWSDATCTVALEADNTFPTLNNPNTLPVTYTSSKTDVATIDANGNITLIAAGTTTITAAGAETDTHKSATTDYTLTVNPSNCRWVEVTDNTTLEDGDWVVIAMANGENIYALPNDQGTSTPNGTLLNNLDGNKINTVVDELKWTVEKTEGNYIFHPNGNNAQWLYCINSDDGVRVGTGNAKTFILDPTNGYLVNKQTTYPRYLRLGLSGTNYVWRCYTTNTTGQTLKFYKRECLDATNYWVTWDAGEGAWEDKSSKKIESCTVGATITEPENPTREGYKFTGWNPNPTTMPAENKTFTAQWAELHTITWMVGSSSVLTEEVANGTGVTKTPASNPEGDAIGDCADTFLGWSEKSAGSTPQDAAYYDDLCTAAQMKANNTSVTGDKTFYAVFATAEETGGGTVDATLSFASTAQRTSFSKSDKQVWEQNGITFTNNKGTGSDLGDYSNPVRLYKNSEIIVEHTSGEITKIVFDCNSSAYATALKNSIGTPNSNTTVAVSSDKVTVTFVNAVASFSAKLTSDQVRLDALTVTAGGGTITTYSNYVTNCCELLPVTNLQVSGVTEKSATLTWTKPSSTTGITKLQVRNAETDDVVVNNIAVNTTTATIIELKECTSYQYYVVSVGEDCEVFSNTVTATPFSGAKTVNYDYNGGSGSPESFTTSCTNQTITLPTAARTGYDFNGWYNAATGGTRVGGAGDTYEPATSPVTLYAQWTIKSYTVTWNPNGGNWAGSTENIVHTYI